MVLPTKEEIMNRTPHVVGGGLGTIRKQAIAKAEKAKRDAVAANNKAALAALRKSVGK
jgi:hypothetical protein